GRGRRGRGQPARGLGALRPRGRARGPAGRGPARSQSPRRQRDRAPVGRDEPRPRARAHPAFRAGHEGVSQGPGAQPGRRGQLREGRGAAHLSLVQFPGGLPPGAAALRRARGGAGRSMKALLVDLDDTLLDYSGGVDECWTAACETVAGPAGIDTGSLVEAGRKERGLVWGDPERHRRGRVGLPGGRRKNLVRGLDRMGARSAELAGPVAEDFAARRWAMMRLFPGVPEALGKLRDGGVVMALVTNGDTRQQRAKIERYDLARFFDAILIE